MDGVPCKKKYRETVIKTIAHTYILHMYEELEYLGAFCIFLT